MTALRGLRESHPEMGTEELQCLNNQVLLMIAEYHLTSASQGTHRILPVLPEGAARLMPPLDEYLPGSFCKVLFTNYAKCLKLVFSSSYAGCVPALFGSHLHLLSEGCALVWGMFVRGCARRDLC